MPTLTKTNGKKTAPGNGKTRTNNDYKVKDLTLADWGRKEISVAEQEMPGLMSVREKYGPQKPFNGVRISGSLHMTIETEIRTPLRSEEHTSELQSRLHLVCRLLLEKKKQSN